MCLGVASIAQPKQIDPSLVRAKVTSVMGASGGAIAQTALATGGLSDLQRNLAPILLV